MPERDCHADEHAAVMDRSMKCWHYCARVQASLISLGRALTAALVRRFPQHAQQMDSVLSHWMRQRRHGGSPIVLKWRTAGPSPE